MNVYPIAAPLLAVAVHECGHFLTARCVGVKTYGFRINRRGIGLARDYGTATQNLAVTMAGPFTNIALVGVVLLAPWMGIFSIWFSLANLGIGVLNMLPLPGSDGKRAFALLGISSFGDLWKNLWNGSEWADAAVRKLRKEMVGTRRLELLTSTVSR